MCRGICALLLNQEKNTWCFKNVARVHVPAFHDNHSPSSPNTGKTMEVTDHMPKEQLQGIPPSIRSVTLPSCINSVSF